MLAMALGVLVTAAVVVTIGLLIRKSDELPLTDGELEELSRTVGVKFPKSLRAVRAALYHHPDVPADLYVRVDCEYDEVAEVIWSSWLHSHRADGLVGVINGDFSWWAASEARLEDKIFLNVETGVEVLIRRDGSRSSLYFVKTGQHADDFSDRLLEFMRVYRSKIWGQWRCSIYERKWPYSVCA